MFDAHAHVISDDLQRYPVTEAALEKRATLVREPFSSSRLLQEMARAGVAGALLVQRGQFYAYDNRYVCDTAAANPGRFWPVCAIDARSDDCGSTALDWLARGAVGFRLMEPARGASLDWLGGSASGALWKFSAERAVPLCVHFFPWNRAAGLQMLQTKLTEYPDVIVVVDHVSNCPIEGSGALRVDDGLRAIADLKNVLVKMTTIPLGRLASERISLTAFVDSCRALFGIERFMWGSDISQSAGTYEQMVELGRQAVSGLPLEQQERVLSENARRIYLQR